ncbi:MAG: MFS transporter [Patescibacteria group bacterium]
MKLFSHTANILWRFLPFWIFMIFFKFGGGLHYSLLSPLGEKVLPLWVIGVLMGAASIAQLLLDVPAGRILDKYGYRKFLKVTTFIFLFAAICFLFGFTKQTYLISLLISVFGWLFFGPGVNAYILSHAPKESAGRFISLRDVSGSIGIVLSSSVLPFVLLFTPEFMGALIFIILAIAFIMLFLSPKDNVSVHTEIKLPTHYHYIKRSPLISTIKAIKKLNPASTMLLLLDLSGSIFYGIIWFVVPLVIAHQANSGLLGVGLAVFDLSIVVLGFMLGNLADKSDKRTMVFFGILLFSVSGMLLGFNFGWLFIIFGFLATTGDEMAGISLWSWLHSLDKQHDQDGMISGVINLFQDLGWAIGPIVAGILYSLIGPSWTILIGALPIFIVWLFYQLVLRHHHIHVKHLLQIPAKPHRMRHKS